MRECFTLIMLIPSFLGETSEINWGKRTEIPQWLFSNFSNHSTLCCYIISIEVFGLTVTCPPRDAWNERAMRGVCFLRLLYSFYRKDENDGGRPTYMLTD